MDIEIRKSSRKTMAIEVTGEGRVIVRAPLRLSNAQIHKFVEEKALWIEHTLEKIKEKQEKSGKKKALTTAELETLAKKALEVIPPKVACYAKEIGVTYGRITIRNQKSRWGSCSGKGNLNFNCMLMLAPEKAQDYVVIHELCHRREMNHGEAFWNEVERVMPDYRVWRRWLKDYGSL